MTHQRDPKVYLDPSEPRCDPSANCPRKARCARYLAPIPPKGAQMLDGTVTSALFVLVCPHFVSVESAAALKSAADKLASRRKVHPAW